MVDFNTLGGVGIAQPWRSGKAVRIFTTAQPLLAHANWGCLRPVAGYRSCHWRHLFVYGSKRCMPTGEFSCRSPAAVYYWLGMALHRKNPRRVLMALRCLLM